MYNMGVIQKIKSRLGLHNDMYDIGCRAVKDNDEICGNEILGTSASGKIKYCSRHAPSSAVPYGRIDSLQYYVPEEDKLIEPDS